jgi:hypothetical protein
MFAIEAGRTRRPSRIQYHTGHPRLRAARLVILVTGLGDESGIGVEPALREPSENWWMFGSKLGACCSQARQDVIWSNKRYLMREGHGQPTFVDIERYHRSTRVELADPVLRHPLDPHHVSGQEFIAGGPERCRGQTCHIHLPT